MLRMRVRKFSGLALSLFLVANASAWAAPWFENDPGFQKALHQQKSTGEPMALYFYTTWCPYCKRFQKNILNVPKVQAGLQDALKVQIDVEKSPEVSDEYGITSFPHFFVVSSAGDVTPVTTQTSPEDFLKDCKRAGLHVSA